MEQQQQKGGVFHDQSGKPSSKRIFGALLIVAGIVTNIVGVGDPETNRVLIWAGTAALGVGTLETRVNK
jgi:hypothetical protein